MDTVEGPRTIEEEKWGGGGGGGRWGVRGRVQSRRDGEFFDPILKVNSKVILGQPAR